MKDLEKPSQIRFISLIPHFGGGQGHIIPYHQAVAKAVSQLGWSYGAIAPQDSAVADIPPAWLTIFPVMNLQLEGDLGQKLLQIKRAIALGLELGDRLKTEISPQTPTIIFLEDFIHLHLLVLALALSRLPVANLSVWLLHRHETHLAKTRSLYRLLHQGLAARLGRDRLQLLTDSELLSQSLSSYFAQPVTVMPIPHTDGLHPQAKILERSPCLLCWWAGSPRLEKGWERIKALVSVDHDQSHRLCLWVAQSADLTQQDGGITLKILPDHLSRQEYADCLRLSDVVLLPYDAEAYRERTSGIFIEAIIAGKLPLVTPQTWMARELVSYDLDALAIDWDHPQGAIAKILELFADETIQQRLKAMQTAYQTRHSVTSFAEQLEKIYPQCEWMNHA